MKKIIHKYFLLNREVDLEESNLKYLCNRKFGDWKRTEIVKGNEDKVTCKNCLKIMKNKTLYNKIRIIEEL